MRYITSHYTKLSSSAPQRDAPRTWDAMVANLAKWLAENPAPFFPMASAGTKIQDSGKRRKGKAENFAERGKMT